MVDGLEKEYGDALAFEVVSTEAEGAKERIARYGFDIHGMVITDADDAVVWKEDGHQQTRERTKAAIDAALGR